MTKISSISWPLQVVVILIAVFSLLFSYIKVEVLTLIYSRELQSIVENNCKIELDFRYSKIIHYTKYHKSSVVMCLYTNSDKNKKLHLNYYNTRWQVVSVENPNKNHSLYWPYYR